MSGRSGKANVWLIRARGGEGEQLTDAKGGVSAFKWSPDGKHIAYTAMDPQTPEEEKKAKEKNDAFVVDENLKMSRLFVIPVEKNPQGKREARQLTTGPSSVGSAFGGGSFDWSPDGKTIVFAHRHGQGERLAHRRPLAGGRRDREGAAPGRHGRRRE